MKEEEILEILKKTGCSDRVIKHIIAVKEVAVRIAKELKVPVDLDLVREGALFHDIGRSKTHGIEHAVVGAEIAKELGVDERVIRIIERHIGSGITRDEAISLGLPPKDYLPETVEEKIVAYADNLLNGDKEVSFEISLEQFKKTLGDDHPAIKRYIDLNNEINRWKRA